MAKDFSITLRVAPHCALAVTEQIHEFTECAMRLDASLKQRLEAFFSAGGGVEKLFVVETDVSAAAAGELFVTLNPTDFFFVLLAAVRAGNFDGLGI